jgi:serine/threonine protein kinase
MNASQQMAARRYRIERYLTEGGMGAIYIGKKLGPGGFEKEVVLKQLLPEYTSRPEFRDLFFREAKISATLDHANIVHTFDLVESDESLFIVMEYVRGVDLRTIVRRARLRRSELAPAAAIHITLDVLAGLGYAHARRDVNGTSMGIIHRDVSPSNILCSVQGEVKLSDFGIAKASTHSSVFYRVRGKVGYMSPEQARNEPVDHRSDLYSLAVCLYEALTGERLFVGDLSTPPDVIYGQPILPPSKKRPSLTPALDDVMAKALAPRPDDRYQDATALTEALRQVAHRFGLIYSAPQLAEHLQGILGPDPSRWLQEDPVSSVGEGGTQKIPLKALEGKEAASIGVVEGSNLYVVSGGDVVSPKAAPAAAPAPGKPSVMNPPRPNEPLRLPGKDDEPTRRVAIPAADAPAVKPAIALPAVAKPAIAKPAVALPAIALPALAIPALAKPALAEPALAKRAGARDPFIPIHEDDDDAPTVARDRGFSVAPPALELPRRPSTAPYASLSASSKSKRPSIPPPPPAAALAPPPPAALAPPPPVFATSPPAFTAPPPPRMPPSRAFADSPFDSDMPTPPPPPTDEFAPPTPAGHFQLPPPPGMPAPAPSAGWGLPPGAPSFPSPGNSWPPPLNLQPPETIDFSADAVPLVMRRSGPPGLLVLIVMLGAMAGGAKLAHVVTRGDVAALAAPPASAPSR